MCCWMCTLIDRTASSNYERNSLILHFLSWGEGLAVSACQRAGDRAWFYRNTESARLKVYSRVTASTAFLLLMYGQV